MKRLAMAGWLGAISVTAGALSAELPQRQMERLDRGVVAVNEGNGNVFVSWRWLGTEADDIGFNVYRQLGDAAPTRLNAEPIGDVTFFRDTGASFDQAVRYEVRPVVAGTEKAADGSFAFPAGAPAVPYIEIPLRTPDGYAPNDCSVGDLDGDGKLDLVVHMVGRSKDNSQSGETDPPILQAYKIDGTFLWEINLGRNIRAGAHYTQFMVYDLDGNGRAELVCKTADGTVDGKGVVIGDANANHRNERGYVLRGPEFLTVFDGTTGAALSTTQYIPQRHPDGDNPTGEQMREQWGDAYGNRMDRFLAGVAYLDGERPSVIFSRGYYTRTVIAAFDWRDGQFTNRWVFDTGNDPKHPFFGQGNHQLSIADVDGDGRDEIIFGACTIDDDGTGLASTGYGHGDALHVGDLDPTRPGLEVFTIQERFDDAGAHFTDARTRETIWKKPSVSKDANGKGQGPGRGVAFDVDPRHPGAEMWTAGAGITGAWNARGEVIHDRKPDSCNFAVWWDGDLLRELLDKNHISKWDWETGETKRLFIAEGCESNNGTKSTPAFSGDILGDWREEVILRTSDNRALRIFTTTIPTEHRFRTLLHDPQYRLALAWQNVSYNQPPHPSFFLGHDMPTPPRPRIRVVESQMTAGERR